MKQRGTLILTLTVAATIVVVVVALLVRTRAGLSDRATTTHFSATAVGSNMRRLPQTVLWAWERPEDLRFINPRETAVAFLHASVFLTGDEVLKRPRLQPLRVPDEATMIAVVRIETDRRRRPALSDAQMEQTISVLLDAAKRKNVRAVQIDFDALANTERDFYRTLLVSLRARLPAEMPVSITALTSWCFGADWLKDLPVDEAVPMLFRMGADEQQIRNRLRAGEDFRRTQCGTSLGVSTDEMFEQLPLLARDRRVYIFNPQPWTQERYADVRRALTEAAAAR